MVVFQDVTDELENYHSVIQALHDQAAQLGDQVCLMFLIMFSLSRSSKIWNNCQTKGRFGACIQTMLLSPLHNQF